MNAHFKIATDAINGCKCYAPTDGDDGDDDDDGDSDGINDIIGFAAHW
jgi:hypothetical protein